ncbi:Glycerophosphocholine phosphodiesterase [Neodidymelliopsis sp. IMI 364377]|nr:Glycerophosphocholine phosphodiesterase [Neodidymelliopsis sp. IMI 364377]
MKFGHDLPRNQVPEWASSYINYKGLKKLIKTAAEASKHGADPDLAEFFFSLDRNLEDVDTFYSRKYAEYARRLRLLQSRYGRVAQMPEGIDKDEAQDLIDALLELRSQLRKLQWYGEVNRKGFVKITKKLDKKIPTSCTQERYLVSRVNPKPFTRNFSLNQDMKTVNEWLSGLGDIKTFDDGGSTYSASSLNRIPGRSLNLPSSLLDAVEDAIRSDRVGDLSGLLSEASTNNEPNSAAFQQVLLNFLQRSISYRAKACISRLLQDILTLEEEDDINKRNVVHRLVISIGRSKTGETLDGETRLPQSLLDARNFIVPATAPNRQPRPCTTTEEESMKLLSENDESVRLLIYLLDQLEPRQRVALQSHDAFGRLPLHYAAGYGFVVICQVVIKHMQDWGQFDVSQGIDAQYWQDEEGDAPLHLSVKGGHPLTTKALLEAENWRGSSKEKLSSRKTISQSGEALALATKSNFVTIVKLLVDAGVDVNYQNKQGETALHIAAQYGHVGCAKALLEGSSINQIDVDIPENTFAWTPLFNACVDKHLPIVELLAGAGADLRRFDNSGWTAKEQAALRGHMKIAHYLAELGPDTDSPPQATADTRIARAGSPPQSSLDEKTSKNMARENTQITQKAPDPVKSYGHRYLANETMILVSLGSMDMRKNVPAVALDDIPMADAHTTQLDTALSVFVSAVGATGETYPIDLPVQDIATEPITFMTKDVSKVQLLFDICPTYAGSKDSIVGRGVALLSTIKTHIGSKRIPLQGDVKVPIVAASTLQVIGTVNFNFLIITPFQHPNMSITEEHTYWKKMASTMVIGHRGLGKNTDKQRTLQLGENTIQSFISAANLGAEYVEFDVQLTKDLVPVIYHDFLVSETGIDAPVHTLTLDQFLHIGEGQKPRISRSGSPETVLPMNGAHSGDERPNPTRLRSYSVDNSTQRNIHTERQDELKERMKYTRDYIKKGYKGNSRAISIGSDFTTLERMFRSKDIPAATGFNIEMKYPMLHESEEEEMDQYAVELNSFIDTVLQVVYDHSNKRRVVFSSFNPDICLMLSFKQPSIPVLFLTDAGTSDVGDKRAASLQEAIRFASRWNLFGIVSAADPLVMCPRFIRMVKENGLVCMTYGVLNNDPKNVRLQEKEGIDAVIVDSVLSIRQGLQAPEETKLNGPHATTLPIHPPPIPVIKESNETVPAVRLNGHP